MPNPLYKVDDSTFSQTVKTSVSIRQVLLKLNMTETGSAYRVFKKRIKILNLDTSHFVGQGHLKGKRNTWAPKLPLNKILIKNSTYNNTAALKRRLLQENKLQNKCSECGLNTEWNGKTLVLQLDHINGKYNDNRLHNLRLLCPNCHSQTLTFAGRNAGAKDRT